MNWSYSLNQFLQKGEQDKTFNKHVIATRKTKKAKQGVGYRLLKALQIEGGGPVLEARVIHRRYDLITALHIIKTKTCDSKSKYDKEKRRSEEISK